MGYNYLKELCVRHGDEAFVQRTASAEFWDEQIPKEKIEAMAEYLQDVSPACSPLFLAGLVTLTYAQAIGPKTQ